ncbi:hypothetical protein [Christensenella timonensis]|uniref:hypothetical protein n=1 Tax=Christensenella timonensis TaxID=1816678 RepID=UPI0011C6EA77|nr:hypothetical protein [Christensenella timonensis]
MKKKLILLLAVTMVAAFIFSGCNGAQEIKRPEPDGTTTEATGSCQAVLNGDTLTVSGETNLMDGTNGIISVLNANGITLEQQKITKNGDNLTWDFKVVDEWPEVVYGFITFDTQKADGQPDEVKKAYGNKFQNLTGKHTIWDQKGVIAVFQSEEVKVK